MNAVLILPSGAQTPLSPGDVDKMVIHFTVTDARTNGSQTQFSLRHKTPGIPDTGVSIVANNHSEACEILEYNLRTRNSQGV